MIRSINPRTFVADAGVRHEPHTHVITHNFTLHNYEDEVAYFREDPALNAFNAYYRYLYPTWMNYTRYGIEVSRHGEQFYYMNSQIYRRYLAERYSNDMLPILPFEFDKPFDTPYNPKMHYHNGHEVPARPAHLKPTNYDLYYVSDIKHYEARVADAIDFGYIFCVSTKINTQQFIITDQLEKRLMVTSSFNNTFS